MSVFAGLPPAPADAAAELGRRGLAVFPCSHRNKRPLVQRGFLAASRDPAQIATWWKQYPQALIGLPTGETNGLWVLDADSKHGDVDEILEELEQECDARFRGPRVSTLNHGRHVYFAHDPRIRIGAGRFRAGVDWRGNGGYVCAPDGQRYHLIADGELEPAPEALIVRIVTAQGKSPEFASVPNGAGGISNLRYQSTMGELAEHVASNKGWHESMVRLVWQFVERGMSAADIVALAPLFQQQGYTLRETEIDIHTAALGAFEKQDKPPGGAHHTGLDAEKFSPQPFSIDAIKALTPRDWIYGHLAIRRFVSVIGAPGGVGKTAYATTVALAIASGRPLLGDPVHKRGRVWLYNLEDPIDEQYRRLDAAMKLHGITEADINGWLFVASGRDQRLCMAAQTKERLAGVTPHVDMMITAIRELNIDVPIIDPFVKSHALNENDNAQIDTAATAWAEVADKGGCAPILVHHFRKGGISGEADAFRGASALVDAARCAVSLSPMDEAEADRLGVDNAQRIRLVRLDNAKLNLAPRPEETPWLELVGVTIGTGDRVQAVRRWQRPSVFNGLNASDVNAMLDRLDVGYDEGWLWSADKQAKERWAGISIVAYCDSIGVDKTEGQAAEMLSLWLDSGVLKIVEFKKPDRKPAKGLRVNDLRRPGNEWEPE